MDCYNGEILTVEMRDNMKKELCMDTVYQLKQRYGDLQGVVLHSDRGSQYTSEAYRKLLKGCGIIQSLSGTGHCYDNARMEGFFVTLKKEKLYQIPTYCMKREDVKTIVFRYIFIYSFAVFPDLIDIKIPPVILNLFVSISLYHTFFCPSNLGRRQYQ